MKINWTYTRVMNPVESGFYLVSLIGRNTGIPTIGIDFYSAEALSWSQDPYAWAPLPDAAEQECGGSICDKWECTEPTPAIAPVFQTKRGI